MIEMDGKEVKTEVFEEAVRGAFVDIERIIDSIDELQKNGGKKKISVWIHPESCMCKYYLIFSFKWRISKFEKRLLR